MQRTLSYPRALAGIVATIVVALALIATGLALAEDDPPSSGTLSAEEMATTPTPGLAQLEQAADHVDEGTEATITGPATFMWTRPAVAAVTVPTTAGPVDVLLSASWHVDGSGPASWRVTDMKDGDQP